MRILVVEDSKDTRSTLAEYLKGEHFAVDAVSSGHEGSYLARTNDYDIIVLDCMLPDKDSLEVCKEVRESGKSMPILILAGVSDCKNKIELLNAGADEYIAKPFSCEEVCAHIRALLRRPAVLIPAVITVGHLRIDFGRQKVFCGETEVYLTRKEFTLLEYMARNEDRVVSRGMIMEHVWNMESDPFSNTIEAHIFNLRKKITHEDKVIIHTIPGRGYCLSTTA